MNLIPETAPSATNVPARPWSRDRIAVPGRDASLRWLAPAQASLQPVWPSSISRTASSRKPGSRRRKANRAAARRDFPRAGASDRRIATTFWCSAGLTNDGGRAKGDGPGDHGRAGAAYSPECIPRKRSAKRFRPAFRSIRSWRRTIGNHTRFPSLQLGCEDGIQGGNCDNGYSCAYSNSISWRTPSTPNPPEIRPRAVFERLFGNADADLDPVSRARKERYQPQRARFRHGGHAPLAGHARASDRRKVDEYLYAIRDIEDRIQKAEQSKRPRVKPTHGDAVPERPGALRRSIPD